MTLSGNEAEEESMRSSILSAAALALLSAAPLSHEIAAEKIRARGPANEPALTQGASDVSCDTLALCIEALIAAARPGPGISRHESEVSEAVKAFGESAVPELLKLLKHQNPEVRALASYTLRNAEGLKEEHLDALIESRRRGDGWIPPAIARIGSRRAIEFLVSELKREPETHTQLTWAFEVLGEKGVPYLLDQYECGHGCDDAVLAVVTHIFSRLGERAAGAVDRLLAIAEDPQGSPAGRRGAIRALGAIGPAAEPAVPGLKAIAANDPETFGNAVNQALIEMGGPEAEEALRAEVQALQRCLVDGTREANEAAASLDMLDERIRGLTSSQDIDPVVRDLHAVLRSRCFRLSAEQGPPPTFGHAVSLQTWWQEGGHAWMASYLRRPRLGRVDDLRPNVVFPPRPRKVLALDTAPTHPLAALLCRVGDETCGRETQGWAERARDAFAANLLEDRLWEADAFPVNREAIAARCEAKVRDREAAVDYDRWMTCLEEHRPVDWALPIGRFKSPRLGWLVIRGRRGHYSFCDEIRAYHLETGAAYVAQSCSGLHLRHDGSVNFEGTNAARKATVSVGRVSVANLREAAWMILLAPEAERTHLSADYFPLPKGTTPSFREGGAILGGGIVWNSGQTRLSWSWRMSDGRALVSGDLTWPSSDSPAETHAARLLEVAEMGLVEGCAPAALPTLDGPETGPGVSAIDARPEDLTAVQRELAEALQEVASSAPCGAGHPE
jgi:HEAT repeat protein